MQNPGRFASGGNLFWKKESIIITLGANGLGFPWETLVEVLILLLLLCDVVFVDKGLLECHPKAAPASKNRVTLSHMLCVII